MAEKNYIERFQKLDLAGSHGAAIISIGKSEARHGHLSVEAVKLLGTAESDGRFDYLCSWDTKEVALVSNSKGRYKVGVTGIISGVPLIRLGAVRGDRFVVCELPDESVRGIVFKLDNLKKPEAK